MSSELASHARHTLDDRVSHMVHFGRELAQLVHAVGGDVCLQVAAADGAGLLRQADDAARQTADIEEHDRHKGEAPQQDRDDAVEIVLADAGRVLDAHVIAAVGKVHGVELAVERGILRAHPARLRGAGIKPQLLGRVDAHHHIIPPGVVAGDSGAVPAGELVGAHIARKIRVELGLPRGHRVRAQIKAVERKRGRAVGEGKDRHRADRAQKQYVEHLRIQRAGQAEAFSQSDNPFPKRCGGSSAWTGFPRSCGARSARAP